MGREHPRIGLVNIGEEPEKGDELALEAHQRLAGDARLRFVGNIEGSEIIQGTYDVLVCDGFVGNVLLKFYEAAAQFIVGYLRRHLERTGTQLELDDALYVLDYSQYGGAPLLGVNGVCIICHGSSSPNAIRNAIRVAAQAVRTSMVEHIARELSSQEPA